MIGTIRRLGRLFDAHSRMCVLLALDHGASLGMIPGLANYPRIIDGLPERRIQGCILNKGLARLYATQIPVETGLVLQLSAGTKHGEPSYNKSLVCSVPEALRLGADAVSVHVNIGNDLEDRMLSDLGAVTEAAHDVGLPVVATIHPQGGQIINELDPALIGHCVRVGAELGSDVVCVPYSGDPRSFAEAVDASPVPVIVTGGPRRSDPEAFLAMLREAIENGATGVCVGRNIFQQPDPLALLDRVIELVHGPLDETDPTPAEAAAP